MALMVWNTSHLLKRTLETLCRQDFTDSWELLIIDDMSEDDVQAAIAPFTDRLPIAYHRLTHNYGMRGNTESLNYALETAQNDVILWSTPEVMLPPNALSRAVNTVMTDLLTPKYVTIPSHGLTYEIQMQLDTVDWRHDLHSIKQLVKDYPPDNFGSTWFWNNFYENGRIDLGIKRTNFGNNQTVAVNRGMWLDRVGCFPHFCDYGSDDPWVSNERKSKGYVDVTLWDCEAYHQWHAGCQYWMAQGKAPNWNRFGHTTSNLMHDPRVPPKGTCAIWDGGNTAQMDDAEKAAAYAIHNQVIATGYEE
jgi:hypothetical protein